MYGDQITGVLVGVAIGDGLGAPLEFLHGQQVNDKLEKHLAAIQRGELLKYTDDTQLTIAVVRGMLAAPLDDVQRGGLAVARRIVEWSSDPENNRAPGRACLSGAARMLQGVPWDMAGALDARGCGAAMRSAPYGIFFWKSPDEAGFWAAQHARMTHRHPAAIEAASIVAEVTALILQQAGYSKILECLFAPGVHDSGTRRKCLQVLECKESTRSLLDKLQGWTGDTAVAAALHCYFTYEDPEEALIAAVQHDGDSDSVGAIVGAWVGARVGYWGLPWRGNVEKEEYLMDLSRQIYTRFGNVSTQPERGNHESESENK